MILKQTNQWKAIKDQTFDENILLQFSREEFDSDRIDSNESMSNIQKESVLEMVNIH